MADPVYTPDNYLFVKQFNGEMDKLMNELGKYENENEPKPDDENVEVTQNYLSHLNRLFNKTEIINSPKYKRNQKRKRRKLKESYGWIKL